MSGGNWKEMFNAACEGNLDLVAYHVNEGADVNYIHPEVLSTPLVACILEGRTEVALFLLDRGANPNRVSESDGCTPAQAARQMGLDAVERRLTQLGVTLAPTPQVTKKSFWAFWRRGDV